jgi:hypothetical protein
VLISAALVPLEKIITNDCIGQTISSSPIYLSKTFVAPATSAPALVLRTPIRVCTFRIFARQRAIISFLTRKSLHASAIAAELKLVYKTEVLALSIVKKLHKRFAEGRTLLYDSPRCGRPLTNNFAEAISSMLKQRPYLSCKVLCRRFHIAKGTCLQILHDTISINKFHLRWVPHALDTNQKAERVT